MSNVFYTPSGNPSTGSEGLSSLIRGEFASIGTAFDSMPQITTTGAFSTVFNQQGSYTFTLPAGPGTLAMLSDVAAETARAEAAEAPIATLAPLASPTFTGTVTVPTVGALDSSTKAANTVWVANFLAASGFAPTGLSPVLTVATRTGNVVLTHTDITDWATTLAPLASPALTGNPTAPTPTVGDADTSIATTAFVATATAVPGAIAGLGLSNDIASGNFVIDIAAGQVTDSTNARTIRLATAFTKSIGGVWTAGSGNNAMGTGLIALASTWYHVFVIVNAGAADVYFDTSATAANSPAGTTSFRRIGSFKLGGATHVNQFVQNGDRFDWASPVLEFNGTPGVTTAVTQTLIGVPLGVLVQALMTGQHTDTTQSAFYLSSLAQADIAAAGGSAITSTSNANTIPAAWAASIFTNASAQIRRRVNSVASSQIILTNGWIDTRGRI